MDGMCGLARGTESAVSQRGNGFRDGGWLLTRCDIIGQFFRLGRFSCCFPVVLELCLLSRR